MSLSFDDHPPLTTLAPTFFPSASSPMSPVVLDERSSCSLQILTGHLADSDRLYSPAGCHPCNLLSSRSAALEVVVSDILPNVAWGDGTIVESVPVEILGLRSRFCQRDTEVRALEGRVCPPYVEVKDFQCQVKEIASQLHGLKFASSSRRQGLQSSAIEHRDRMHEFFKRPATQSQDHVVE